MADPPISDPMQSTVPIAMDAATYAVRLVLIVGHVELYRWLRGRLASQGIRAGRWIAAAAAVIGVTLVFSSELMELDFDLLGMDRNPTFWRLLAGFWTAGFFGAYAMLNSWRLIRRMRQAWQTASRESLQHNSADVVEPTRREALATLAKTSLAVPFAFSGYGTFIARAAFEVRENEISFRNLPPDLDGLRIAQVTDIHAGPHLSSKQMRRIVEMANETKPQLAFITGDLVTKLGDPLEGCIDIFSKLKADSGIWGCMGNHEHFCESEDYVVDYGRKRGMEFMRQTTADLRFGQARLNLVGVDYQRKSRPYLEAAEQWVDPAAFNLLLSHNPDVFPTAAELGYDLTVSGHTHGGQVTIEIVEQHVNAGRFYTPYVAGAYNIDDKSLYVSRGVGTVNLPMRIGALPEITLLTLRRA